MTTRELRDPVEARRFLAQGLWWQRGVAVRAETTPAILEWALALSADGTPLPPLGFVADVGHLLFRPHEKQADHVQPPGWPIGLMRSYEDYVLGRLLADNQFERAQDALMRYDAKDRPRALAYLLAQLIERAGVPGVLLSPATIKSVRDAETEETLRIGWQSFEEAGPLPLLQELYADLVRALRNASSVVGGEDVFELERKTAIAQFGQRVALRQVVRTANRLQDSLPRHKPRASSRRHEVPTRILEEDTYPVGGFSSLATRGSIESLLHSQLAFMEQADRPDLFDIKFLRDELLYYARDENSFLRRRRTFVFVLYPDLVQARIKDADAPVQRIISLLALVRAAVVALSDWLNTEALAFEVVLIDPSPLATERELLEVLLADSIANGTATIQTRTAAELVAHCARLTRRSSCHVLLTGMDDHALEVDHAAVDRLRLNASQPALGIEDEVHNDDWSASLVRLLKSWI